MQKQRKFKQQIHNGKNYKINKGKIRLSLPISLFQQLCMQFTQVLNLTENCSKFEFQQNDRVRRFFIISITQRLTNCWKVYSNQLVMN